MALIICIIAFGASAVGTICGIGGGVIIKPLMDALNIASVAEISFLSGCTVLSMSCYSVGEALLAQDSLVRFETGTPLALGAAAGGILGKSLFSLLQGLAETPQRVGGYQAVCLAVITAATGVYTLNKERIHTHRVRRAPACAGVGLALGLLSSFLGIGGGPINLVVLNYFFSMSTREAAQNSLYCILISQAASLVTALVAGSVPAFRCSWLVLMVLGGIGGGAAGRQFSRRLDTNQTDRLFIVLIAVIVAISCCNARRFLAL